MQKRIMAIVCALTLAGPPPLPAQAPVQDAEVARGIQLATDGDYDGAILTLDNAARRLAGHPDGTRDLAQAYVYLGVAYLGKGAETSAKAQFREALAQAIGPQLSARDPRLSPVGGQLWRRLSTLLALLARVEEFLSSQGRAGLTVRDREILAPRFERLSRDASSVAALSRDLVVMLQ